LFASLALSAFCHTTQAPTRATEPHSVQGAARTDLTAALLAGDEERVHMLTAEIFAGKRSISKTELADEREAAPNIFLRATYENRGYQLGVNTVSEYVLCNLQIQSHASSENILRIVAPALQKECSSARRCEVCDAQAFPVSTAVKRRLVEYWSSKLK
jgi:hypothetical protein